MKLDKELCSLHVTLNIQGHFRRQLEAVRDSIDFLINKLDEIPEKYCENCGEELMEINIDQFLVKKECSKCGEKYVFPLKESN